MDTLLSLFLKKYDPEDKELFLKSKFILITTLLMIFTLSSILIYSIYLNKFDSTIMLIELSGFVVMLFALGMLVKGNYNIAINTILISGFTTTWTIMFLEPKISMLAKMDTIVFIVALFATMPLMFFKNRKPMVLYFGVNMILFLIFNYYLNNVAMLTTNEHLDYFFDNFVAMIYVFFLSFSLFSIYQQVLISLKNELKEKEKAEKKLRQSEEKFRTAFKTSPQVITLTSIDNGTYIDVNDAFTKLLGYSQKDVIGESSVELNIWNDLKDRNFLIEQLKENGLVEDLEAEFKGKTGQVVNGLMSARILDIDNKRYLLSVTQDITGKKAANRAMRLMQYGVDRASDSIFWMDSKAHLIYVNDSACNSLGYTREELLSMNLNQVDPNTSLDTWPNRLAELKQIKSKNFESQHRAKDGQLVPVEVTSSYIFFEGEEGIFSFARNITERKKIEEKNKNLKEQINQAQKMEALGTLAGGIAHDFNNILSGIFGYSQLAKTHLDDPGRATKNIDQILKGAKKAADLVKQILTFSRKSEHEMQPLKIFIEVKEAVKLLRASIPSSIGIQENIVSKATVLADLTQIHQVVMNLCTNAYHAMIEKGGVLSVDLNEIKILDTNSIPDLDISPGHYLKLEISDTGSGMSPETIDKIFEPYFTTKEFGEGTGLGLAVVLGIVKEHNGFIKVYSKPGKGSSFHIYFPILEDQINSNTLKEKKNIMIGGTERIMIVDDETNILFSMQEFLEKYGYTVKAFSDSEKALKEFKKNPYKFDLIITDMAMPKMTGKELSIHILKIRADLPIVLSTGYSENFTKDNALKLGIKKYIQKPIESQDLLGLICEVLDKN